MNKTTLVNIVTGLALLIVLTGTYLYLQRDILVARYHFSHGLFEVKNINRFDEQLLIDLYVSPSSTTLAIKEMLRCPQSPSFWRLQSRDQLTVRFYQGSAIVDSTTCYALQK